ncbi:hypothetical protein O3M35_008187 [Rhynocoris fuscipes]|uniref:Uncharacterized protein n=1 Tax=Rhynocoris fuscipes TaxID=488301 RepID=A0AAW1D830_9HEMI
MLQMKWHSCLADIAQKLIKAELSKVKLEYTKFLSWLQPFLSYSGHKIRNFELFCWQHCWSD